MDRRAFITMVGGGVFAAPLAGEAQQTVKVRRIGFLSAAIPDPQVDDGVRRVHG